MFSENVSFSSEFRGSRERLERHYPLITDAAFSVFRDQDDMLEAISEFSDSQ